MPFPKAALWLFELVQLLATTKYYQVFLILRIVGDLSLRVIDTKKHKMTTGLSYFPYQAGCFS